MYAFVAGSVHWIEDDAAVILSGGLGLRIRVLPSLLSTLREGDTVELFLHHIVREEQETLVGFTSRDQERLFATLLDVSGVGPKVALALLDTHGAEGLRRILVDGDEKLLATAPGVGRRLAARIIVELADRIARGATGEGTPRAGE
ncbi:MAG: Holliday junction branch migration protein RuvA, partial [Candidatus Limnocylindrus sp.]